jgi:hypothetical protein
MGDTLALVIEFLRLIRMTAWLISSSELDFSKMVVVSLFVESLC